MTAWPPACGTAYEAELLPVIAEKAVDRWPTLRAAIAGGLDAAGEAHGDRGAGRGQRLELPVKGEGTVIEAEPRVARARR